MANISVIKIGSKSYDVKDTYAREQILNHKFTSVIAPNNKLPELNEKNAEQYMQKIYLITDNNLSGNYIEYIVVKSSDNKYNWEQIGTTKTDLDGYVYTVNDNLSTATVPMGYSAPISSNCNPMIFIGLIPDIKNDDILSINEYVKDPKIGNFVIMENNKSKQYMYTGYEWIRIGS